MSLRGCWGLLASEPFSPGPAEFSQIDVITLPSAENQTKPSCDDIHDKAGASPGPGLWDIAHSSTIAPRAPELSSALSSALHTLPCLQGAMWLFEPATLGVGLGYFFTTRLRSFVTGRECQIQCSVVLILEAGDSQLLAHLQALCSFVPLMSLVQHLLC